MKFLEDKSEVILNHNSNRGRAHITLAQGGSSGYLSVSISQRRYLFGLKLRLFHRFLLNSTSPGIFFNTSLELGRVSKLRELEFFPWVLGFFLEFWGFSLEFFEILTLPKVFSWFFFEKIKTISKMFPFLKIFGNKNGIFRGTPGNFAKRWGFFLSFYKLE